MEGVGPRQARSSRHGPSVGAAVFSGPVRKWKRKWVQVSSSPSVSNHRGANNNSRSHSNGRAGTTSNANSNSSGSRLVLCRWTPLSASTTNGAAATTGGEEEPPKRKFRYTPIVVLEERRKAEKKLEDEDKTSELNQFMAWKASENDDEDDNGDDNGDDDNDSEQHSDDAMKKEIQVSNTCLLDLGLGLKGHSSNHKHVGQRADGQVKKASPLGFPTIA